MDSERDCICVGTGIYGSFVLSAQLSYELKKDLKNNVY